MLQTPILVSNETLMLQDICYGVDINSGWVDTVHSAGSHDLAHNHPKVIAGLVGYPSVDLSDEAADIIAKETGWVDVEKLAINNTDKYIGHQIAQENERNLAFNSFIDGFKANQSLNENKFTLAHMEAMCAFGISLERFKDDPNRQDNTSEFKGYIAELTKPKVYKVQLEMDVMLQKRWGTEWHDLPNQKEGRDLDGIYQNVIRPKKTNNKYKVLNIIK